jgi:hypothetical protein
VNVALVRFVLFEYPALVPFALLRVALYPLNIWALEIVEGCVVTRGMAGWRSAAQRTRSGTS